MDVAGLLAEHSPPVRDLVERIRRLILNEVPEIVEKVSPGWHSIGYHHPDAGYVFAIFPQATSVKLGFEHGIDLVDPGSLLELGGRTQVGYVVLQPGRHIPRLPLRSLIAAAIDEGARRRG